LASSAFVAAPWGVQEDDVYIPSKMSVESLRAGLAKFSRPIPRLHPGAALMATKTLIENLRSVWTDDPEDYILTLDDAKSYINRSKSAGYPFYYKYRDKGHALDECVDLDDQVHSLLHGNPDPVIFSLTLKTELRLKEKVDLNKTRVFMSAPLHHVLASLVVFNKQNDQLIDKRRFHPIKTGVSIPGNDFVNTMLKIDGDCYEADVDGCDLCYPPEVAAHICHVVKQFLPARYHRFVDHNYSSVYAGLAVACGGMYRVYGNKSGQLNTSRDNSLMLWWYTIYTSVILGLPKGWEIDNYCLSSDDSVLRYPFGNFKLFVETMTLNGCTLEVPTFDARPIRECVFLSHHLRQRFVPGFGDFLLAAGNLPKLLSSLNWVKKGKTLTFEESCVAHLIGLRICLFPWKEHFDRCDAILSKYLSGVVLTDFMRDALNARLNERELAFLNTRVESYFSSRPQVLNMILLVLKPFRGRFKSVHDEDKIAKSKI